MFEVFNGWLLAALYFSGFSLSLLMKKHHWAIARATVFIGLIITLVTLVAAIVLMSIQGLTLDKVGLTMTLLVSLLGWVVVNFSARYLQGEPNQPRFVRAMLFTLSSVALLVVSRHLAVIVLAWSASSFSLHHLLTIYQERKAAQLVAHKKFIVSRLADLCLFVALILIYNKVDTLSIDGVVAYLAAVDTLPIAMHWAAVLCAMAAILKSAQLPLHGWLIQVMEAPTPVSALLHAGVVNIGGFVLIRLSELLAVVPVAQAMLVIVGSTTAVLAGLVMMTRISIKVRLAWSTCAQMGFMLMEIGLGLYELALLHLVAHSLYKAHAFLNAGNTVAEARVNELFANAGKPRPVIWYLVAFMASAAVVAVSILAWQWFLPDFKLPLAAAVIVSLGLAPLLWLEAGNLFAMISRGLLGSTLLTQIYLLWHLLFAGLAPAAASSSIFLLVWVSTAFALLYATQIWLRRYPQGRFARALYPWAYYGFYLDETFTRLTFKFWPLRLNPLQAQTLVHRKSAHAGEML